MLDLGDIQPLTVRITDADNALTNATTISLTITLPDGTPVPLTVGNPPAETGVYAVDYPTVQAGRHTVRWTSTGPQTAYTDQFDVREASPGAILSLADAKNHLQLTATVDDEELRGFVEACTPVVEDVVGPVVVRSFAEVQEGGPLLVLHRVPAISLTTLVPVRTGGDTYLPADLDLDPATGIVRRLGGGGFRGPLRVTYLAGRRIVPSNITKGCGEILRHAWSTQRMPSMGRPGFGGEDEDLVPTPSGFLIPYRAMGWLQPHKRGPVLV